MTIEGIGTEEDKTDGRRTDTGARRSYSRGNPQGNDRLERCAALLMDIMERLGIPKYRHAKSNHVYSYRQKIALLVMKERLGLSYRQFCTDIPSCRGAIEAIGLKHIPDPTTLIAFAKRADPEDIRNIIAAFREFCSEDCTLAIDCTGFSNFVRSAHYNKRCRDFGIRKEPRQFTKASYAADTDTHLIVSAVISAGRKHDIRFVPDHVKDLKGMRISHIVMDRGYDSEALHGFVRKELGCVTVIPCRKSRGNRGFSAHGMIRNQMLKALENGGELKQKYNRRPQVETVNFMVKTHTGSHILSKLTETKVIQGLCKVLAHNCKIVAEKGLRRLQTLY